MQAAAQERPAPEAAVLAILGIAACTDLSRFGCFFINTAMELTPSNTEVRDLGRRHLARVDNLLGTLLGRCGLSRSEAQQRSSALLALAAGAVTLRKADEPQMRIVALLQLAPSLITCS